MGASFSTHSITMTMASASALKNPAICARGSCARRVTANAKTSVKIKSGRIESFAAEDIGFVGTNATIKSRNGGCSATAGTVVSAARSAAALSAGMGHRDSKAGVSTAPKTAEIIIRQTTQNTVRAAIGPARAASALFTMPVTSNATTRGTTVIRRPLSQREPTMSSQ